jgi:hypothetical protein
MDEYVADPLIVFGSDRDRRSFQYRQFSNSRRAWTQAGSCRFPGCSSRSVRRSHTIPRAWLSLIAEEGHVLTPLRDSDGNRRILPCGVGRASTFPGFCVEHENLFSVYELEGSFQDEGDYCWQVLRTVLQEIAVSEHDVRFGEALIQEWLRRRKYWLLTRVIAAPGRRSGAREQRVFRITLEDDVARLGRLLERDRAGLQHLVDAFLTPFGDAVLGAPLDLPVFVHRIDIRLPIALAGRSSITVVDSRTDTRSETILILTILPTKCGTEFVIAAEAGQKCSLLGYVGHFLRHGEIEGLLRMAETWLLHGTRRWFITPSTWNDLPGAQKEQALKAVASEDCDVAREAPVRLLEAVRRRIAN